MSGFQIIAADVFIAQNRVGDIKTILSRNSKLVFLGVRKPLMSESYTKSATVFGRLKPFAACATNDHKGPNMFVRLSAVEWLNVFETDIRDNRTSKSVQAQFSRN